MRFTKSARRWPFGAAYRPNVHQCVTESVGEYAIVAFPDLVLCNRKRPSPERKSCERVRTLVSNQPLLGTVATLPTGYQTGGRGSRLTDRNMWH